MVFKTKSDRPFTFDRTVRLVITIALVVGIMWLMRRLSGVLLPFLAAWLIAFILEPVVQLNMRMLGTRRRFFPVVLTLGEIVGVIVTLGLLLAPSIATESKQAISLISDYISNNPDIPAHVQQLIGSIDIDAALNNMSSSDWKSALTVSLKVVSEGFSLIMGVAGWIIMLLYLFFIMIDYDKLNGRIHALVPNKFRRPFDRVISIAADSIGHYFRGQFVIATAVGVLFSIGFLIIGMPMAVMFGLIIGVLNLVPYLQLISIPPAALLCLVHSAETGTPFLSYFFLQCMAVYVVVQLIQDLILTPRIMGKAMDLNPALIFLSLSVWGSLLGFVGFVVALPLTALLLAIYKQYVVDYYNDEKAAPHSHPSIIIDMKEPPEED
ncbi:MAG: AI-2E family transporter [Muribaculaceae bacterium]|nr:AI-2E family transporter [Muribaculaceae bacterium]